MTGIHGVAKEFVLSYYPAAEAAPVMLYKHTLFLSQTVISDIVGHPNPLHPSSTKERKTDQERQRKYKGKWYILGWARPSSLLPHLEVGPDPPPPPPGAPKKPYHKPPCPARRSVPPPWPARPRRPFKQRGHVGASNHTPSLFPSTLPLPAGLGSTPSDKVGPGLSLTDSTPSASITLDLADLIASVGADRSLSW